MYVSIKSVPALCEGGKRSRISKVIIVSIEYVEGESAVEVNQVALLVCQQGW